MKVGIINLSKDPSVTFTALEEIASAIEEQSFADVAVFRQTAGVQCGLFRSATAVVDIASGKVVTKGLPPGTAPHLILDYPADQGELGDHYVTEDGMPILRSFWGPTRDNGGTLFDGLSTTMSHEHIEASEDPYANGWYDWPDGIHEEANEPCDRPEGSSYKRPGSRVALSNFLGPRASRPGPGPYDFMQLFTTWDQCPGDGYRILRVGGPQGTVTAAFGERYPEWKRQLKMLPHTKASRRGVVWVVENEIAELSRVTEPPTGG